MNPTAKRGGLDDVPIFVNLTAHAVVINEATISHGLDPRLAGHQCSRRMAALTIRRRDADLVVNPLPLRQELNALGEGMEFRVLGLLNHGYEYSPSASQCPICSSVKL